MRILPGFLIVLLAAGCDPEHYAVDIPFDVQFNGLEIGCARGGQAVVLTDLRFFVHDFRLIGADDREIPVVLVPDGVWQNDSVALLDFENGSGACLNGTARMNTTVHGFSRAVKAKGLIFEIGVPEALNHADPLLARPPLDYSDMHWHWASGYKFFRGGIETADDGFWLHLGSSRCQGTIGDIQGCLSENRPTVRLDGFEPGTSKVIIDIGSLFAGVDLSDGQPGDCSSGPADEDCEAPFTMLGIDFESGDSATTTTPFSIGLNE